VAAPRFRRLVRARSGQAEAYPAFLEVVGAFGRREAIEQRADGSGSGVGFAQKGLHFCEGLFNRIEVRRIGRQEEDLGFGGANGGRPL
jgi:hypothetical protein